MRVIGITGGIGSGKTTVVNMFKSYGVPLFIADDEAKLILAKDHTVINKVKLLLGVDAYVKIDGVEQPNRKFIASKVFNDKELLKELNKIIHPAVRLKFNDWVAAQDAVYGMYEAAILYESGGDSICDSVVLITAPRSVRVQRVMARDKVTEEEVIARMENQWTELKKLNKAEFVLPNKDIEQTKRFVCYLNDFLLNN
ncbi:dephospho-CoA kinase [Nonlabens sp. SCSIO 43208]|uniref:dephospho-CoA kinase n=1 Tax=Nonlabens sp. SCSIO 43208 TaxID=2793009 RepID=UPI003D6B1A84